MKPLAVILLIIVLLCSAGCVAPLLQEPTVTVETVTVENVTLQSVDLSLQVTVENPNPIGATLTRVAFDVFFLENGQWVFLAGVTVAASCVFDALDGALARVTGTTSAFGAFFDSFLDRYAEAAVYAGILVYYVGAGTPWGVGAAFTAAIGSLMVSYSRARAEGLGVACRAGLFARPERLAVIIAGLATGFILPALVLLAVGTNATAVRRLIAVRGAAGPGA